MYTYKSDITFVSLMFSICNFAIIAYSRQVLHSITAGFHGVATGSKWDVISFIYPSDARLNCIFGGFLGLNFELSDRVESKVIFSTIVR